MGPIVVMASIGVFVITYLSGGSAQRKTRFSLNIAVFLIQVKPCRKNGF
jgi:hypothetical protein